jgi:hypothetical protein
VIVFQLTHCILPVQTFVRKNCKLLAVEFVDAKCFGSCDAARLIGRDLGFINSTMIAWASGGSGRHEEICRAQIDTEVIAD